MLGGIWVLNRDGGDAPSAMSGPDGSDDGGRRGGGGGISGRAGGGRRGRGYGGGVDAQRETDMAKRRAILTYARAATESPRQLTIVVHDTSVNTMMRTAACSTQTDNKKIEERAENGLIKISKQNHWDEATLVSEVTWTAAKIIRSYALLGRYRTAPSHNCGRQGRPVNLVRLYERPVESK